MIRTRHRGTIPKSSQLRTLPAAASWGDDCVACRDDPCVGRARDELLHPVSLFPLTSRGGRRANIALPAASAHIATWTGGAILAAIPSRRLFAAANTGIWHLLRWQSYGAWLASSRPVSANKRCSNSLQVGARVMFRRVPFADLAIATCSGVKRPEQGH